jgi:hypothetical protein
MKISPGMAVVGAIVLAVATALITRWRVHALDSCDNIRAYDNLNEGFYSLVIKKQPVTDGQLRALKKALGKLEKDPKKLTYCFWFNPAFASNEQAWHDGYPYSEKCPIDDSPMTQPASNYTNMSVLSHKIYSVNACDIEKVIDAIK